MTEAADERKAIYSLIEDSMEQMHDSCEPGSSEKRVLGHARYVVSEYVGRLRDLEGGD